MFYNGIQSDSSITVVVQSGSNGTAVLTLSNGDTGSAVVDTATNYGNERITLSGLSPNTHYTYSVTVPDGTGGNGEITTFKTSGNEKLAFCSCESNDSFEAGGPILQSGAKMCMLLGDETYTETVTFPTNTEALDLAVHYAWHKAMRDKGNKMHMAQKIGFGAMTDDHDTFLNDIGDDTADPPASLNTELSGKSRETMTAAQWATCLGICGQAVWAFQRCNPQEATVSDDTDPLYFAFDCGDMRVIVPALCLWTKTEMKAWKNTGAPIMGANQLAWFKNELSTTSKTFKVILSQKCTYISDGQDNSDDWDNYSDMDTVLGWISSESTNWSVPGGVIWGTGDWHSPGVGQFEDGVDSATYDHVVVNACPSGRFDDISDPGNRTANTKEAIRPSEIDDVRFLNYGIVESFGSYIEISVKLHDGSTYTKGRVNAGENKIATIPPLAVSI